MGKLVLGLLYRDGVKLERAIAALKKEFGDVEAESLAYDFNFTDYYEREMGKNLMKKFVIFGNDVAENELGKIKIFTNLLEDGLRIDGNRTVNIDPGILSRAGLVLASNKEKSYKQKIAEGIFAHRVYSFSDKGAETYFHTFPDFRQKDLMDWFFRLR
ncbi:MAG TPA: DUF4416 family protein [Candidatus Nanoarchaeia archaeon]|nr:DUF4416 family protein [Candidatus Nanoarchaeia archaeon]